MPCSWGAPSQARFSLRMTHFGCVISSGKNYMEEAVFLSEIVIFFFLSFVSLDNIVKGWFVIKPEIVV